MTVNNVPFFGIESFGVLHRPGGSVVNAERDGGTGLFIVSGATGSTVLAGPSSNRDVRFTGFAAFNSDVVIGGATSGPTTFVSATVCNANLPCAFIARANATSRIALLDFAFDAGVSTVSRDATGPVAASYFGTQGTFGGNPVAGRLKLGTVAGSTFSAGPSSLDGSNVTALRSTFFANGFAYGASFSTTFSNPSNTFTVPSGGSGVVLVPPTGSLMFIDAPGTNEVTALAGSPDGGLLAVAVSFGPAVGGVPFGTILPSSCTLSTSATTDTAAVLIFQVGGSPTCLAAHAYQAGTKVKALGFSSVTGQLLVAGEFTSDLFGPGNTRANSMGNPAGFIASYDSQFSRQAAVVMQAGTARTTIRALAVSAVGIWASGDAQVTSTNGSALVVNAVTTSAQPVLTPSTANLVAPNFFVQPLTP